MISPSGTAQLITLPSTIAIIKEIQLKDERVLADSTQICQILLNLCTNAAHAMEKATDGALTVRAEMTHLTNSLTAATSEIPVGDYITITVSDTRHGTDPQTLHQIFDPSFTTKEIGKGTGRILVNRRELRAVRGRPAAYNQGIYDDRRERRIAPVPRQRSSDRPARPGVVGCDCRR